MNLDEIGIITGTDKSRLKHDYLRQYERIFSTFKEKAFTLIEIGIHNGASLSLWERNFKKAKIIGIDIAPSTKRFERERVSVEIGSQFDSDFLNEIANKYSPSIILDDGSHIDEHQIFTFTKLFPALQPGGIYVVEDIQVHKNNTPGADHFLEMIRRQLLRTGDTEIASFEVIPGAVIVRKKISDELDKNFPALEKIVDGAELPDSKFYLSRYMQKHGAPLENSLSVIRHACELAPNNPWAHFELSKILALLGQRDAAIQAVQHAIHIAPLPSPLFRDHLIQLEASDSKDSIEKLPR